MAELPTQDEILEKRVQELGDKAKAETPDYTKVYDNTTSAMKQEMPKLVEGALDKLMELYVDNLRENGKSSEGIGAKVYGTLSSYLRDECFGFQEPTKELGRTLLNDILGEYIGTTAGELGETLEEEDKVSVLVFDGVLREMAKNISQRVGGAYMSPLREAVAKDAEGFRKYVSAMAKEGGVSFANSDLQSIEGMMGIYMQALQAPEMLKAEKKLRKKKGLV